MLLALRSLLNSPQPLFSYLRPVSRHASHGTAVLASQVVSRGYASNNSNGDDSYAEVNRQHPAAKRHLYIVLDDSKHGFGIHKLDIDDDEDPDGGGARRLPEPPLLRVAFPTVDNLAQFAAVGTSIVALGTCRAMHYYENDSAVGGVLIYDTKTAAQVFSPQLPKGFLRNGSVYQAAITVGNRLYMFESSGSEYYHHYKDEDDFYRSGLHCLTAHPGGEDDEFWNWQPLCPSSPFEDKEEKLFPPSSSWYWKDNDTLMMLPFRADHITAHAVHRMPGAAPHEHEIFVSAVIPTYVGRSQESATFSFGVMRCEWTHPVAGGAGWMRHGDWHMPIVGHAHYDGKLDKWLGLHLDDKYTCWPDGYLCIGNVMSAPSEWKVGKQKLCCLDEDTAAGWNHVDAKLVPMESTEEAGTEYCLMERLRPEEGDEECLGDGVCLLRLSTFRVKTGENGEPMTMASRPARSYKVSRYNRYFEAQVFWL